MLRKYEYVAVERIARMNQLAAEGWRLVPGSLRGELYVMEREVRYGVPVQRDSTS